MSANNTPPSYLPALETRAEGDYSELEEESRPTLDSPQQMDGQLPPTSTPSGSRLLGMSRDIQQRNQELSQEQSPFEGGQRNRNVEGLQQSFSVHELQQVYNVQGLQQYPMVQGPQQYPTEPGLEQYPTEQGLEQYPTEQGPQQYPTEQGPPQYSVVQGPPQYPIEQGPQHYPIVQGPQQYPIVQGPLQYPIVQGLQQYPFVHGLHQYPMVQGPRQSSNVQGLHQTERESLQSRAGVEQRHQRGHQWTEAGAMLALYKDEIKSLRNKAMIYRNVLQIEIRNHNERVRAGEVNYKEDYQGLAFRCQFFFDKLQRDVERMQEQLRDDEETFSGYPGERSSEESRRRSRAQPPRPAGGEDRRPTSVPQQTPTPAAAGGTRGDEAAGGGGQGRDRRDLDEERLRWELNDLNDLFRSAR